MKLFLLICNCSMILLSRRYKILPLVLKLHYSHSICNLWASSEKIGANKIISPSSHTHLQHVPRDWCLAIMVHWYSGMRVITQSRVCKSSCTSSLCPGIADFEWRSAHKSSMCQAVSVKIIIFSFTKNYFFAR